MKKISPSMKKAPSVIKKPAFSLIEVVLAISLFAIFALSSVSILLYSEDNFLSIGQSSRASFLAEEAIEATRAIKKEDFALLADGDHGLSSSSGKWQFSGTEDVTDGYTRKVNISSLDSDTKKITVRVAWLKKTGHSTSIDLASELSNWSAYSGIPGFGNWTNPIEESSILSSGQDGLKLQVKGNNLFVVRDSASESFISIDITDTNNPVVKTPVSLQNNPKNLAILNNLTLIATNSNTAELQTADITNPNTPILKGVFNAEGNSDAMGIAGVGNLAYLTRLKGEGAEFYVIDITNPDNLNQAGSLEISDQSAYEVVIIGNYAYVSTGNTVQLKVVNITDPTKPIKVGFFALPQNQNALTVAGFGNTVIIGTDKGFVYVLDVTKPLKPKLQSTLTPKDNNNNIVYDLALGLDNHYLFLAGNVPTAEFQVFDISNPAAPSVVGSYDAPSDLFGVAYDGAKDRAFVTGSDNFKTVIILAPQ